MAKKHFLIHNMYQRAALRHSGVVFASVNSQQEGFVFEPDADLFVWSLPVLLMSV